VSEREKKSMRIGHTIQKGIQELRRGSPERPAGIELRKVAKTAVSHDSYVSCAAAREWPDSQVDATVNVGPHVMSSK